MMKKEYSNPALEIIDLYMQQSMLAGSGESLDLDDTPTVTPTPGGTLAPGLDLDDILLFDTFK